MAKQLRITLKVKTKDGETFTSGLDVITEQMLLDEPADNFGTPVTDLEETKKLMDSVMNDWSRFDHVTVRTAEFGSVRIAVDQVAYILYNSAIEEV